MAEKPPLKDFQVPVEKKLGKSIDLPISSPDSEAAKKVAERIAKRRGWKSAKIGKPEEEKP